MIRRLYEKQVLPFLVHHVCRTGSLHGERAALVPHACGHVLELGVGSGLNLPFYDPRLVSSLAGIDPSRALLQRAHVAGQACAFPVRLIEGSAEALPMADHSVDTVLTTYSLCTIPDVQAALAEAMRVLKPGGHLLFLEHGLAEEAGLARFQRFLNPIWKPCAGGCHLTRTPDQLIMGAGFSLSRLERYFLASAPRFAGALYRGHARKAG